MTTTHRNRIFDVAPSKDPGNAAYPVTLALRTPDTFVPTRRVWRSSVILDQGEEGACVGHGCTAELLNSPVRVNVAKATRLPADAPDDPQAFAFWLYGAAKRVDEFPGEDYDGTSLNAGMKVLRDAGLYKSWHWANSRANVVQALLELGPVVVAIPWHEGMYDAPGGVLRVEGDKVGYHCILVNGYDPAKVLTRGAAPVEAARVQNSWGRSWGRNGLAWISMDDLWRLLSDPDACAAVAVGRASR